MPNEPDFDLVDVRQLAADVFVMGFPLVLMDAVRRAHPIELNRILLLADNSPTLAPGLADEGDLEVRTSAWIDVGERPVVMHLPHMHGRYFSVTLIDASGDPFASLGSHTGDAAGSDLAIVGPRWRGELSGPLKAVRSVTDSVWALSRITANSAVDRVEAEALAARQALTPMHEAGEAGKLVDRGPMRLLEPPAHPCVQEVLDMTPEMFTHRLNLLVERSAQGLKGAYWPTLRARLRAVNELGKPGEIGVDSELGRTLSKGFADGAAAIKAGAELAAKAEASGWRTFGQPPSPGAGPLARAVRVFTDLGGPMGEDVLSLVCDTDEAGRELSGAERYRIHFARGATPPVVAFWSLLVTSRSARGGPTGPWRGIGDRNDLTANPDGSLDLIIQHELPAGGPAVNWLEAPAGPFILNMRLHWPRPPALSGAWRMPAVERLGSGFARRAETRQPGPEPYRSPPKSDGVNHRRSVRPVSIRPPSSNTPGDAFMKAMHVVLGASLAITLAAAEPSLAAEAAKAKPAPAAAAKAKPAPAATAADARDIEPEAVSALQRMSAYLGTLDAFELKNETSLDLVRDDGQKIELDGTSHYIVQRPNGFMIEVATDKKVRQFYYDGKTLTVNAPKLGYYSSVPAPSTIRETLDLARDRYGIVLPLEDLFRWNDPTRARTDKLESAMVVGASTIGGVQCDQYAFREGDIDWQIWIQRGDKPLPRKVVIVDRTDDSHPAFSVRLNWDTSPQLSKDAFAFSPPKDAKAIRMAAE